MAKRAARQKKTVNEVTMLGTQFIRWGLGLFIFGLIIGYGPLAHYLHGALEEVGPAFLQNVTLWFGSLGRCQSTRFKWGRWVWWQSGVSTCTCRGMTSRPSGAISPRSRFAWPVSSRSSSPATSAILS